MICKLKEGQITSEMANLQKARESKCQTIAREITVQYVHN